MLERITLDNGVRVVTDIMPNVRSISIGIWVATGSRNEVGNNNGISHFIEHLLFKGTKNRTAKQIAEEIDNIGGQLNAFTAKEVTCYYTKTLDSHYKKGIDLLADIFFNSNFSEDSITTEKGVIYEEIGMYQDSLDELVQDMLSEAVWKNHSLGMPILGTNDSLSGIQREDILKYFGERYTPNNTVISIAGNFNKEEILETIKQYFEDWKSDSDGKYTIQSPTFSSDVTIKEKDSEQAHISLALDGVPFGSDELFSLLAVNNIFGGTMSSRLFQNIREKHGLVYSVFGYPSSYKSCGLFNVYAGLNPSNLSEVIKLIMDEITTLIDSRLSLEEISKAKEQLKGNYILGLEGTGSRMSAIGKSESLIGQIYSSDNILNKIEQINEESINNVINKVFNKDKICLAVVGKDIKDIDYNKLIKTN